MSNRKALQEFALRALGNGISMLPIDRTTKRPYAKHLPQYTPFIQGTFSPVLDEKTGNPVVKWIWKAYQVSRPTAGEVTHWIKAGAQIAFIGGGISGGLECIDHDDVHGVLQRDEWCVLCDGFLDGIAVQQTGGGGYQYIYRYETTEKRDGNLQLAFLPDDDEGSGRSISIETRGEGGYFVVAPSFHPSGNQYVAILNDVANPITIKKPHRDFIIAQSRACDKAPLTRQQQNTRAATAPTKESTYRASLNGHASVIDAYNSTVSIESVLHDDGYKPYGDRFVRPNGSSPSVIVKDNRSYHHSSNDPKNDGYWHTPFDYMLEHVGGSMTDAVREAARTVGMQHEQTPPTDATLIIEHGTAYCPVCSTAVKRSKYDYPGTHTPGWYCPSCKGTMKWPNDAYIPLEGAVRPVQAQSSQNGTRDPRDERPDGYDTNLPFFKLMKDSDLKRLKKPEWLVKDMVQKDCKMMAYGPSGCGKSFLMMTIGSAMAYEGYNVVYISAEAMGSNSIRRNAWIRHHQKQSYYLKEKGSIEFIGLPVNFFDKRATVGLLASLQFQDSKPDLVIIDTIAKSMDGADENTARDMAIVNAHMDMLRRETGATICLVHHSTKGNANVERGSGALFSDMDHIIQIERDENDTIIVRQKKVRDHDSAETASFYGRLVSMETEYTNAKGEPIMSAVLLPAYLVQDTGLTLKERHWKALDIIEALDDGDGIVQRDVAIDMKIESSQASRILKTLLAFQYVRREPKEKGKGFLWAITDSGRNALKNQKLGLPVGGTNNPVAPFGWEITPKESHTSYTQKADSMPFQREITPITGDNERINNNGWRPNAEITPVTPYSTPLRGVDAIGCILSHEQTNKADALMEITEPHGTTTMIDDSDHESNHRWSSDDQTQAGQPLNARPACVSHTDLYDERSMSTPRRRGAVPHTQPPRRKITDEAHLASLRSMFGDDAVEAYINEKTVRLDGGAGESDTDGATLPTTSQPTPERLPRYTVQDDTSETSQEAPGSTKGKPASNHTGVGRSTPRGRPQQRQATQSEGSQVEWSDGVPLPADVGCEVAVLDAPDDITSAGLYDAEFLALSQHFEWETVQGQDGAVWVNVYDGRTNTCIGRVGEESRAAALIEGYLMANGEL